MPKGIALGTNDRQRHFAKSVQQAFGRGLTGTTFGIPSEETSKLLVPLTQTLPDETSSSNGSRRWSLQTG